MPAATFTCLGDLKPSPFSGSVTGFGTSPLASKMQQVSFEPQGWVRQHVAKAGPIRARSQDQSLKGNSLFFTLNMDGESDLEVIVVTDDTENEVIQGKTDLNQEDCPDNFSELLNHV